MQPLVAAIKAAFLSFERCRVTSLFSSIAIIYLWYLCDQILPCSCGSHWIKIKYPSNVLLLAQIHVRENDYRIFPSTNCSYLDLFTLGGDQKRISPHCINPFPTSKVMRTQKNISYGILIDATLKFESRN